VGSPHRWTVPLTEAADCPDDLVGGKATKLARLMRAGFAVPGGFCLTTGAYEQMCLPLPKTRRI
jgi:rifampicin phosphotransferase